MRTVSALLPYVSILAAAVLIYGSVGRRMAEAAEKRARAAEWEALRQAEIVLWDWAECDERRSTAPALVPTSKTTNDGRGGERW